VTFTAPSCAGFPATVTGYRVISTPGCFTGTGSSSPVVVGGLASGTSYTFKVQATNATAYGALSASSNSITAALAQQAAFTSSGTYSWIVPAGLSPATISMVAVGGGGTGMYGGAINSLPYLGYGGGGGALAYTNSVSVTSGESFTIVVGSNGGPGTSGGFSGVSRSGTYLVQAGGGQNGSTCSAGGTVLVGTGGAGGAGARNQRNGRAGGGAGGYAGAGGCAGTSGNGTSGSGGGGGGGRSSPWSSGASAGGGGGGGVGILGQGSNGAGGTSNGAGGGGGSSGTNGETRCAYYMLSGGAGGSYGGGGAGGGGNCCGLTSNGYGQSGAVRLIYSSSGVSRSFPSTNTGDL